MPNQILFLLIMAIIWAALYLVSRLINLGKYGLEMEPFLLAFKTTRLNNWLDRVAKSYGRALKLSANIGVLIAGGQAFYAVYFLSRNISYFIYQPAKAGPVIPFMPGLTVDPELLLYLLIPLMVVLLCHEVAHGVIARLEDVPVKSAGVFLAFMLFGAFVEPDEEVFKKSKGASKLRVLSAGTAMNFIVAILTFLLVTALLQGASGIVVYSVEEEGQAYALGLRKWDLVYGVNGKETRTLSELEDFLGTVKPGDTLNLNTSRGILALQVLDNRSLELGVTFFVQPYTPFRFIPFNHVQTVFTVSTLLIWTHALNLGMGVLNMLPLYTLDGEGYFTTMVEMVIHDERKRKYLRTLINAFAAFLLFANIALTIIQIGYFLRMQK